MTYRYKFTDDFRNGKDVSLEKINLENNSESDSNEEWYDGGEFECQDINGKYNVVLVIDIIGSNNQYLIKQFDKLMFAKNSMKIFSDNKKSFSEIKNKIGLDDKTFVYICDKSGNVIDYSIFLW